MAEQKYTWGESTSLPEIDHHSKVKHQIIRDYIETYVRVLMSNPNMPKLHLSLIDGFSGGGLYRDGDQVYKGSPYILLESPKIVEADLNEGRVSARQVLTQTFLVDIEPENLTYLQRALTRDGYGARFGQDIHFFRDDFVSVLPQVIQRVKAFKGGERALFLLDQYNYTAVPMAAIQNIFQQVEKAEVLLTFNIDSLITYISDRKSNRKPIEHIGLDAYIPWEKIPEIKAFNKAEWKSIIQNYFAEGIRRATGARFMTLFFITPHGSNTWSYWFIHLANTFRANDVMKALHWRHGNLFSHALSPTLFLGYDANCDQQLTGQDALNLGQEHAFELQTQQRIEGELSEQLPRLIYDAKDGIRFEHLMANIANFTMADAEITKQSLDLAIRSAELEVTDHRDNVRRTKGSSIKPSDIIRPSRQRPLFLLGPKMSSGN